jgi:EmrB/QacA subfamily drug resistance transporter
MDGDSFKNRRAALMVTTPGSFLIPFMGASVNIALPSIGKEFLMDAVLLGWITTSFILALTIFLIPFGRVADIYGRKKIFLYGFIIYTAASLLLSFCTSGFQLISLRIVQGIGASMAFNTMIAILMAVFPAAERGKVLGINVAAVYLGLSCGPFLGGLLTYYFGWRSIFFVNVPLGTLIILFTLWKLKGEWTEARGEKFDFLGSLLFGSTVIALMYGLSQMPGLLGIFPLLLSGLGILGFVKWETSTENPLFDIDLFKSNRTFTFSNLAALINYSATTAVTFLLSLYLQLIKGLGPREAGLILIFQPMMQALLSPFAGKISDRIEPQFVASSGMGLTAVGLFLLIFLNGETSLSFIVFSLILLGIGFGLFSSPNTNAIMSSVEKRFYGVASGTLGTMRTTGMMFSMGMAMVMFALYMGRTQILPPYFGLFIKSVKTTFAIFTGLCIIGIFASLSRGRLREGSV